MLVEEIRRIHAENYGVYGYRKMHHAMRRAGWEVGRDQTARLMKAAGLCGSSPRKWCSDPSAIGIRLSAREVHRCSPRSRDWW
uniref:IS3 family transposase n=1 Tax=Brachybacterium sp. GPGPB12 TaxID=3023517 RepID=UPI0040493364